MAKRLPWPTRSASSRSAEDFIFSVSRALRHTHGERLFYLHLNPAPLRTRPLDAQIFLRLVFFIFLAGALARLRGTAQPKCGISVRHAA